MGLFYFFLKSVFKIGESEQKLGRNAVFASDLLLRDDPITHLRALLPDLCREGRQQRYRPDLNQDRNKFWRNDERAESKWELDSRNVKYGIFRATPKKRAN